MLKRRSSLKNWTKEETEILLKNYNRLSNDELLKLLPTRSYLGIYKRAYHLGLKKDKSVAFMNRSAARSGEKSSSWRGGKRKHGGYIQLLIKGHHRADPGGYVFEHIVVWENHHKQLIPDGYCVHHINGIKTDNRPENLLIMEQGEHTKLHHTGMKRSEETKLKIREAKKKYA